MKYGPKTGSLARKSARLLWEPVERKEFERWEDASKLGISQLPASQPHATRQDAAPQENVEKRLGRHFLDRGLGLHLHLNGHCPFLPGRISRPVACLWEGMGQKTRGTAPRWGEATADVTPRWFALGSCLHRLNRVCNPATGSSWAISFLLLRFEPRDELMLTAKQNSFLCLLPPPILSHDLPNANPQPNPRLWGRFSESGEKAPGGRQ